MNFALLRENAEAAGQLLDDTFFPRAQACQIDFRRGEFDAPVLGLMRFFQQLGHVQQRLRRNAAAVEADAAGIHLRVDQRDGHAEIGSEKCGGVSTGTAADDCNVQIGSFRHESFEPSKGTKVHEASDSIRSIDVLSSFVNLRVLRGEWF